MPIRLRRCATLSVAAICLLPAALLSAVSTEPFSSTEENRARSASPRANAIAADERSERPGRATAAERRFRPKSTGRTSTRGNADPQLPFGIPRVAGLSITVDDVTPAGAGMSVDFSVQLTTVREVPLSFSGYSGTTNFVYYGFGYFGAIGTYTAANNVESFGGGSPQRLGTLNETITDVQRSTYVRDLTRVNAGSQNPSSGLVSYVGGMVSETDILRYSTVVQQRIAGALPGIAFGDGSTQSTATLPLTSVVSTTPKSSLGAVGLRTTRFRRSGFSYVYADQAPRQIVVNSGCCSLANFPFDQPGTGTSGDLYRTGTFATNRSLITQRTPVQGSFRASGGLITSQIRANTGPPSATLTTPFAATYQGIIADPYLVDQVRATALVALEGSVLEIPSAGTYGLGILAVALSFLGVLILRRS